MTGSTRPIATPLKVRLRHLGIHWLQGVLFVASLCLLAWLWSGRVSQVTMVGQVEAVQVSVPSPEAGLLMRLDDPLTTFDRVDQDVTLIARIDVSTALNEMQTLSAERDRLQSLIDSERERLRLEQRRWQISDREHQLDVVQHALDRQRNRTASQDQVDELRREVSDLRQRRRDLDLKLTESSAQRVAEEQTLKGLQRQRAQVEDLVRRNVTPALRLEEINSQIELNELLVRQSIELDKTIKAQLDGLEGELSEAQTRLKEASVAWSQLRQLSASVTDSKPPTASTQLAVDKLLEPLTRALAVQDAKARELAQRIAANEIRAPVSGVISKIHSPVGTYVRSGEPILTIASENSKWIVAYVDQRYRGVLRPNDQVDIRVRGGDAIPSQVALGTVANVGVQFELVPEHLRRAREIPQWGLPVRIAIPQGLSLMPGEMVDLVFSVAASGR